MQITFRVLISELKELTQFPSLSWTLSHSHFWGYLAILWSIGSSTRVEAMDEEAPLVDDKPVEIPKKNHARDVHILSSAFLLVFLAYGAVQNLESTLNTVSLVSVLRFCIFLFSYAWLLRIVSFAEGTESFEYRKLVSFWNVLYFSWVWWFGYEFQFSNQEEDLGTTSLGILYVSFTFFSLVASMVVRGLGSKNALVLGTTGYWLFLAANLKPSW